MKKIKINNYEDLKKVRDIKEDIFIVNLKDCILSHKTRVIDFFGGLTFYHGSIKKLTCYEYEINLGIYDGD